MTAFVPPSVDEVRVLWRQDDIVAVDKPWGLLVHNSAYAGKPERSLKQVLACQLGRKVQPVHRLDRGTSGVVWFVVAPTAERVSAWSRALASDSASKRYLALVRGRPTFGEIHVDTPIRGEDGSEQPAASCVRVIARSDVERCSLVEVQIHTGRRHQIRRHLAHLRHPVINDSRHGDAKFNRALRASLGLERLALHAWSVTLTPPGSSEPLTVETPLTGPLADAARRLFGDHVCDLLCATPGASDETGTADD